MMRHFFATTLGQILTIIATSSVLTFLLFLLLLSTLFQSGPPAPPWPWQATYRIVNLVGSLHAIPDRDRAAFAAAATRPDMTVRQIEAPVICSSLSQDTRELELALKSELSDSSAEVTARVCAPPHSGLNIQAVIRSKGETIEIRTVRLTPARFSMLTFPFVAALLFLCIAVTAMSAWAVWRVIGPLRRLSAKADAFGKNIVVAPIDEEGPLEIRSAARAFNHMQERITRSMHDRTRMLAAISHDLRTPLTRMRLQLEAGQGEIARAKLVKDVDLMQSMLTSTLAFLSGSLDEEERDWLDLGALLSTLCDEYEEGGANVSYEGPSQIRFFCRPNAINRALTNLIDNGTHFGDKVGVKAIFKESSIIVDVNDNGPGIPADRVKDVIEPFVRLDPSRSQRPGSVGLGLSIVKEIVEAHAGTLTFINGKPSGLTVRITFSISVPVNVA